MWYDLGDGVERQNSRDERERSRNWRHRQSRWYLVNKGKLAVTPGLRHGQQIATDHCPNRVVSFMRFLSSFSPLRRLQLPLRS